LCDLLNILERITGTTLTPNFLPARSGDVRHSRADITSARQLLGFDPTVSLTTGLKRTIEAMQGSSDDRPWRHRIKANACKRLFLLCRAGQLAFITSHGCLCLFWPR